MNDILVSVCVITYNHCNYIRQCLDGILMQQTNFPIEVIVNDDCSTDGTAEIIKEYELKYPHLFKPIYQVENQYSKGVRGMFAKFCFPKAKGKYIAMCEGDDYWTDPLKLQKQVDFLELNHDYSICGHNFIAYNEASCRFETFDTGIDGTYQLNDLINRHVFCSTLSIVFRNDALDVEYYLNCRCPIDVVLTYMLLKKGKGFCLPSEMAVYRKHEGGVWSSKQGNSHIYNNLDIRHAIYELERTPDSAMFIITYIKKLGRRWMIQNFLLFIKSLRYINEQFGIKYTVGLIINIILKA